MVLLGAGVHEPRAAPHRTAEPRHGSRRAGVGRRGHRVRPAAGSARSSATDRATRGGVRRGPRRRRRGHHRRDHGGAAPVPAHGRARGRRDHRGVARVLRRAPAHREPRDARPRGPVASRRRASTCRCSTRRCASRASRRACSSRTSPTRSARSCPTRRSARLVRMLARREIPLIEDDIYGDLHFDGARPRPARAFDRHGLVMLCASFSKTLAPGYRVGFVAPGRFRDQVERLKFAQSVATPTLPQMAIADFLENGGYERHLRKLRRAISEQVARVSEAIAVHFPAGTRISRPRGGFLLWVEMPSGKSALDLHDRALVRGVSVAPGPHLLGQAALHELRPHQLRLPVVGGDRARDPHARRDRPRALGRSDFSGRRRSRTRSREPALRARTQRGARWRPPGSRTRSAPAPGARSGTR